MQKISEEDHKLIALWAADCAAHVFPIFEKEHIEDDRPRKAIEAARSWAKGKIKISDARKFALAAHAAAREAKNPEAIAVARSAGHAAATAHVPGHAKHAASYALKASANASKEKNWQLRRLPEHLIYLTE
jgi:hypothetical protein